MWNLFCSKPVAQRSLFSLEAVERLFDLTSGVPRRIRQLAELSLLAGAAESLDEIPAGIVDSVQQSLTSDGMTEAA